MVSSLWPPMFSHSPRCCEKIIFYPKDYLIYFYSLSVFLFSTVQRCADCNAFVKAWCKGHFHPGCYYPGDYQEKNQDLQVKQRALDRWFNLPKTSSSSQDLPGIDFPSLHWCKRDDIRDPCNICGQVLPINTDTTWKYQPCGSCLEAGCIIPPDETCCGQCPLSQPHTMEETLEKQSC